MKYSWACRGFTLVEMAVVLVIVGLLVGSFIGTFSGRIDTTRRDNTEKELEEIKQVLMAYAFTKTPPQLPCPDTDADGLADTVMGNCTAAGAVGLLPWRDLGFGGSDAWHNRYSYWVSNNYAGTAGFDLSTPDVDAGGGSAIIQTRVNDMSNNIVTNAVAVIFSHGKNGLGAISVENANRPAIPAPGNEHDDENENVNANFVFMSRTPTEEGAATTGGVFDDILVWINSYELKAKMVEAGALP